MSGIRSTRTIAQYSSAEPRSTSQAPLGSEGRTTVVNAWTIENAGIGSPRSNTATAAPSQSRRLAPNPPIDRPSSALSRWESNGSWDVMHRARTGRGTKPASNQYGRIVSRRGLGARSSERMMFTGSACDACDPAGHFDEPWWLLASDVGGPEMSVLYPCLIRSCRLSGEVVVRLGVPLVAAYDLRVFFRVVGKEPLEVVPADVPGFITAQQIGRIDGGGPRGWSADGERAGVAGRPRRTSRCSRMTSVHGAWLVPPGARAWCAAAAAATCVRAGPVTFAGRGYVQNAAKG